MVITKLHTVTKDQNNTLLLSSFVWGFKMILIDCQQWLSIFNRLWCNRLSIISWRSWYLRQRPRIEIRNNPHCGSLCFLCFAPCGTSCGQTPCGNIRVVIDALARWFSSTKVDRKMKRVSGTTIVKDTTVLLDTNLHQPSHIIEAWTNNRTESVGKDYDCIKVR